MGRVARYKKIKSFDPYSKENRGRIALERVGVWGLGDSGRKAKKRSLTSQKLRARRGKKDASGGASGRGGGGGRGGGFDLPPPDDEDEFDNATLTVQTKVKPLTLDDIEAPAAVGTTVVTETTATAKGLEQPQKAQSQQPESQSQPQPQIQREMEKEQDRINSRFLKLDEQALIQSQKKAATAVPQRLPGESKNAYRKRVQADTKQMIRERQTKNRNPEKKQRKKEFLKNKKLKKKGGLAASSSGVGRGGGGGDDDDYNNDNNDNDDGLVTAERAVAARALDAPRFGEQATRPPELKLLPRGAQKKRNAESSGNTNKSNNNKKKRKKTGMDDETVRAEQEAMEALRRKVQAQYAVVRAKRRGDFHL